MQVPEAIVPLLVVTLISSAVAVIMSLIVWRVLRQERRRSDARVATLASEIHGVHAHGADVRAHPPDLVLRAGPNTGEADLFAVPRGTVGRSRWGLTLIAGALAIAVTTAIAVVFSGGLRAVSHVSARRGSRSAAVPETAFRATPRGNAAPLELVALEDTRDGEALTVRGVLLNPPGGAEVDGLIAVVFGFSRDGEFLASGRSAVASGRLPPGVKSSFTVTVAEASGVVRYRVSFRTDDRVVPHADRRAKS